MKYNFLILFSLTFILSFSQNNTEVFMFDIENNNSKIKIENGKNLSNNPGYDNQPSFFDERYVLFASTRNEQTDIAKYDMRYHTKSWLNYTEGGEYTPLKVPERNAISAVRLDKDGKQRLYRYMWSNGESEELIEELVVAYYTWYNQNTIVSAVIENDKLNLYVTDITTGKSRKYASNVGRSFHNIPNSNLVSFISKNSNTWQIKSLNPKTGATRVLANTIKDVEDICWLDDRTILSSKDDVLYKLTLKKDNNWKKITDLSIYGIEKITRISTNPLGTKLLVAAEISESSANSNLNNSDSMSSSDAATTANNSVFENIVQKQLVAYNAKNVDAFMAMYSEDVKLFNYPNEVLSEGKDQMRKDYLAWFNRTPDLKATVNKRIVIGNKVIDEEQVTANGKVYNTVAIYEITNGLISKVTFMQ